MFVVGKIYLNVVVTNYITEMFLSLNLFLVDSLFLLTSCSFVKYKNGTEFMLKTTIIGMDLELLKGSLKKLTDVQHLKVKNYNTMPYLLGEITCTAQHIINKMTKMLKVINQGRVMQDLQVEKFLECHRDWYDLNKVITIVEEWEREGKNAQRDLSAQLHNHIIDNRFKKWMDWLEGKGQATVRAPLYSLLPDLEFVTIPSKGK